MAEFDLQGTVGLVFLGFLFYIWCKYRKPGDGSSYNGNNNDAVDITLPEGKWDMYVNGEKAGTEILNTVEGTVNVPAISAVVLVEAGAGNIPVVAIVAILAVIAIVAGGIVVVTKKKAKEA